MGLIQPLVCAAAGEGEVVSVFGTLRDLKSFFAFELEVVLRGA